MVKPIKRELYEDLFGEFMTLTQYHPCEGHTVSAPELIRPIKTQLKLWIFPKISFGFFLSKWK